MVPLSWVKNILVGMLQLGDGDVNVVLVERWSHGAHPYTSSFRLHTGLIYQVHGAMVISMRQHLYPWTFYWHSEDPLANNFSILYQLYQYTPCYE